MTTSWCPNLQSKVALYKAVSNRAESTPAVWHSVSASSFSLFTISLVASWQNSSIMFLVLVLDYLYQRHFSAATKSPGLKVSTLLYGLCYYVTSFKKYVTEKTAILTTPTPYVTAWHIRADTRSLLRSILAWDSPAIPASIYVQNNLMRYFNR